MRFDPHNFNVNVRSIELAAENEDILDDWKHSLLRAGVHLIGETVEENADKKVTFMYFLCLNLFLFFRILLK